MEVFMGLALMVLYFVGLLLWQLVKLLWRFLVWGTEPIRDEIAYQKMVKRELEKDSRIREAHRQAIEQIDQTVAYYVDYHKQSMS
jgi:hypothetical protein